MQLLDTFRIRGTRWHAWTNAVAWLTSAVLIVLVVVTIPWHMDEWVMYHPLACWQTSQQVNVYRESCAAYATTLGPLSFHRSFAYAGVVSSLAMAPFHALSNSIWMPFFVGAGCLVLISLGIAKSLGLARNWLPVPLLAFPFLYSVLHDGGPVRFSLLALAWSPYFAMRHLAASGRRRSLWAATLVLTWLIAVEDKPFFVFLIPGIIAFSVASLTVRDTTISLRNRRNELTKLFGLATSASILLLLVLRTDGRPYLLYLKDVVPPKGVLLRVYDFLNAVLLLADWPFYAHRTSAYPPLGLGDGSAFGLWGTVAKNAAFLPGFATFKAALATLALTLGLIGTVALLWQVARRQLALGGNTRRSTVLLLGATEVLWLGALVSGGWANHHFIFALVPLFGLLMLDGSSRPTGRIRLSGIFTGLTTLALIVVWLTPTAPLASREIPRVVQIAVRSASDDTVINCSYFGCYFTYSFGNEREIPVVYADNRANTASLEETAHERHWQIMHVCIYCDLHSVSDLYSRSTVTVVPTGTKTWRLYRVSP